MANELHRMWVNQPSALQTHHSLNGTNVLAQLEHDDTMRVFFLSGDIVSMQMSKLALSPGWIPAKPEPLTAEIVDVVSGLHKALSRMVDVHDPDSIEAEWLGYSNELHRQLTGHDVPTQHHWMTPS